MRTKFTLGRVLGLWLTGLSLLIGGCRGASPESTVPKPKAAAQTIVADVSASTIFVKSPSYANVAIKQIGQSIMLQRLGDTVRIVASGDRSADNAVDVFSEKAGYSHRLPAVRKETVAALTDLIERMQQSGGQGTTNLTYTLENAHPVCTPGSRIIIMSDGIEDDERYSAAKALSTGQPIRLPPPTSAYLRGCSVQMIGIGMAPQSGDGEAAQTLPSDQVQSLISGWRDYLTAAGVDPADMKFVSIL